MKIQYAKIVFIKSNNIQGAETMLFPFRVIESKISQRNEFDLTTGYQPTHSLFYLKRGSFDIEINNVKEKICEGDCVLLPDYIFSVGMW